MNIEVVTVAEKLDLINDYWHPKIAGELNGQHIKLVKLKGEFVWHLHETEDEMFMVLQGSLQIALREKVLLLNKGDFVIIPKGVEHKPIAAEEVHVMLFEPCGTLNTGNSAESQMTRNVLEKV